MSARADVRLWQCGRPRLCGGVMLFCHYGRHAPTIARSSLRGPERRPMRGFTKPRRSDWIMGRWLAHQALSMLNGTRSTQCWIGRSACGAPEIQGKLTGKGRISISHGEGWVGVAVRRRGNVGLDIECGELSPACARYFLSSEEENHLTASAGFPLSAWVAKEAAYKAWRCDRGEQLRDIDLSARCGGLAGEQNFVSRRRRGGTQLVVSYRRFQKLNLHIALAAT